MRLALIFITAWTAMSSVVSAQPATKYALLVGVTNYEHARMNTPKLQFPEADAKAVQELLVGSGYKVDLLLGKQATQTAVTKALENAGKQGTADGVVLIGLFGHGVQYGQDAYFATYNTGIRKVTDSQGNLLREKNGQPKLEPDPASMVGMRAILDALVLCGAKNRVLLADCCREDPSAARGRAFGSKLRVADLPAGTAALFACSANERAFEHTEWGHGAFTRALLDQSKTVAGSKDTTLNSMSVPVNRSVLSMVKSKTNGRSVQTVNPIINGIVDLQLTSAMSTPLLVAPFGADQAKAAQEAVARSLSVPSSYKNSIGMEFKLIPPGEFRMGSGLSPEEIAKKSGGDETKYYENEHPQHRVRLTQAFFLGRYEVTQEDYQRVMGLNPSYSQGDQIDVKGVDTSRFPVQVVSWFDAVEFCNKLSTRAGLASSYRLLDVKREDGRIKSATVALVNAKGYRLPTEAEWEYACRAGTTTAFHFGTAANGSQSNVLGVFPFGTSTKGPNLHRLCRVGSYSPNNFGLSDMCGNVMEWCEDRLDDGVYGKRGVLTVDPAAVTTGEQKSRILRGGSWTFMPLTGRSADRTAGRPNDRDEGIGFRVVLPVSGLRIRIN